MLKTSTTPTKAKTIFTNIILFVMMVLAGSFSLAIPANAATTAVNQCNYADNAAGGLNTECEVTVVNNLNMATGVTSSTVTVNDCHGAANAEPTCITTTTTTGDIVNDINQCNNSTNAGGGTVICNVSVTNNITGDTTLSAATVNQCIGSGGDGGTEPTLVCDPIQSTTSATVDQCNGSGNGGGGQERVKCTVASESTISVALPITVDQCNDSANGGGAYITCFTRILNNIIPAEVVLPPTDTDGDGTPDSEDSTPNGETPPTDEEEETPVDNGGDTPSTPITPVTGGDTPTDNSGDTPENSDTPNDTTDTTETTDTLAETGVDTSGFIALTSGLLAAGMLLLVASKRRSNKLVKN